jgi:hypothetical protein
MVTMTKSNLKCNGFDWIQVIAPTEEGYAVGESSLQRVADALSSVRHVIQVQRAEYKLERCMSVHTGTAVTAVSL